MSQVQKLVSVDSHAGEITLKVVANADGVLDGKWQVFIDSRLLSHFEGDKGRWQRLITEDQFYKEGLDPECENVTTFENMGIDPSDVFLALLK